MTVVSVKSRYESMTRNAKKRLKEQLDDALYNVELPPSNHRSKETRIFEKFTMRAKEDYMKQKVGY